jgi:peptidyl-prolyl cis-trans isomerase-like 2
VKCVCWECADTKSTQRQDVITLQNPHGFTPMSVPNPSATSSTSKPQEPLKTVTKTAASKSKEPVPCEQKLLHSRLNPFLNVFIGNISPYSSGLPGASLTSTSVDPQIAGGNSSKLLWDEVSPLVKPRRTF